MFRIPNLVRLYLSALQLPVQPMMPTIGPFASRWRHDFVTGPGSGRQRGLPAYTTAEDRPGIRHHPVTR